MTTANYPNEITLKLLNSLKEFRAVSDFWQTDGNGWIVVFANGHIKEYVYSHNIYGVHVYELILE